MLISVVTPTLNSVTYLRECIESVRSNQTAGTKIEHVIVDSGSTDGTVELATSLGVRVVTGEDRGIFDAINRGSVDSSGELLGYLGADDVSIPGGIEAVAEARASSACSWVVGGIRWIDVRGRGMGGLAAPPTWMTARMLACLGWNPIMHMATFLSREFFTQLGGFDISFLDSGDYEMFVRARSITRYVRIDHPLACFRRTGVNNSVVNRERARHQCDTVLERFGPRSILQRRLWRYAMKIWFNAANPAWLAAKLAEPVRVRVGMQERSYF
jgi:glycosyltransferase involved in cell wall biosynthesis